MAQTHRRQRHYPKIKLCNLFFYINLNLIDKSLFFLVSLVTTHMKMSSMDVVVTLKTIVKIICYSSRMSVPPLADLNAENTIACKNSCPVWHCYWPTCELQRNALLAGHAGHELMRVMRYTRVGCNMWVMI